MGRGPFVQTVTVRKKINYEYFQHGNTRIAKLVEEYVGLTLTQ